MFKQIDLKKWDRIETFDYYIKVDHPRYQMTFELDVTDFVEHVKMKKQSFYLSFIHFVLSIMNEHQAFHYRMVGENVICYDDIHPSFTDSIDGTDRFKIVTVNYEENRDSFIMHAKEKSIIQGNLFIDPIEDQRKDLVYITTFPWATYTQVSHAENFDRLDAIPRLVWGKWKKVNDRLIMPFSIEVHHAFVDGLHVGKFIQEIEEKLKIK